MHKKPYNNIGEGLNIDIMYIYAYRLLLICVMGIHNMRNPIRLKLTKRPLNPDIDASTAYSHVYNLMKSGEPLPKETVAAWG